MYNVDIGTKENSTKTVETNRNSSKLKNIINIINIKTTERNVKNFIEIDNFNPRSQKEYINKNNINKINIVSKPIIMKSNPVKSTILSNKNSINVIGKRSFTEKPSVVKTTKVKSTDPFALGTKHKTNFGYVYSAGGVPCRIMHGSVKLKLKWDIEPDSIILFVN